MEAHEIMQIEVEVEAKVQVGGWAGGQTSGPRPVTYATVGKREGQLRGELGTRRPRRDSDSIPELHNARV